MSPQGFVGDLLIRVGVVDAAGLARALEVQSAQASTYFVAILRIIAGNARPTGSRGDGL
jgi:hypothetical protein